MADWMGHVAWWARPIYDLIGNAVMSADVLFTDDTPVKVLAPGEGKTATGRLWVYLVDERPWSGNRPPAAYYRYSPDRKGERPKDDLARFTGFLQADAFTGYESLTNAEKGERPDIIHVACMAHARRHFYDAFVSTKSQLAEEALRRLQELYAIEADINGLSVAERLDARKTRSVPLLTTFKEWLDHHAARLSSKTDLGKAIQYAINRWDALTRYATDGRLAIDNNPAERALRGIAVSRKNFLFLGSDEGGRRASIIYTLVESAKLCGLNPQAYLADIIDRMAKGHPSTHLEDLLPWRWREARLEDPQTKFGVPFIGNR
jgi:hypothetical protein